MIIIGGLNEINDLSQYQSYVVQCDQKNNKTLVLNAIKNADNGFVTIATDEQNTPTGTYLYLSIISSKKTGIFFQENRMAIC
jgi:hypothetical protein